MAKILKLFLLIAPILGCSKLQDLDAPCTNFGKYCPQYLINEKPIQEKKNENIN